MAYNVKHRTLCCDQCSGGIGLGSLCLGSYVLLLAFMNTALAQAPVFEYPRNANYVVIEYTQSHDMIINADPIPMLRIYGDGRVHVHYAAYMKLAGDYEIRLSDADLQQLLNSLEQKGLFSFNRNTILQLKKQSIGKLLADNKPVTVRTDASRSRFKINLSSYQAAASSIPQTAFNKSISWKNLKSDALSHPNVTALQNAAAAELELSQYLVHQDLVKIK